MKYDLPKIPLIENDVIKRHVVEKESNSLIDEILKSKKVQPISPKELVDYVNLSPELIDAINELIRERWDGNQSIVHRYDIGKRIHDDGSKSIDVDDIIIAYKRQGWNVTFNGMSSFFTFTKK
jgi:hypothetical protein